MLFLLLTAKRFKNMSIKKVFKLIREAEYKKAKQELEALPEKKADLKKVFNAQILLKECKLEDALKIIEPIISRSKDKIAVLSAITIKLNIIYKQAKYSQMDDLITEADSLIKKIDKKDLKPVKEWVANFHNIRRFMFLSIDDELSLLTAYKKLIELYKVWGKQDLENTTYLKGKKIAEKRFKKRQGLKVWKWGLSVYSIN